MTDHCHADTIVTFERAAELAAHRASLALPVAVSDGPLLKIPEAVTPEVDSPTARFEEYDRTPRGRPAITEPRPSITNRRNAAGQQVFAAQVRMPNPDGIASLQYIGRFFDRVAALAACEVFIARGEMPEPKPRGAKPGSKHAKPAQRRNPSPAKVPLAVPRPIASPKAVPEPPRAKTATEVGNEMSEESRIEMMKRIWRRGQ